MNEKNCLYTNFLSGDESALEEIVREYKNGLILFVNGFVRNIDTAEDLTEDVFVKLIVKKPRLRDNSKFKSWLYSVARNVSYDYLRKNKSNDNLEDYESELYSDEELLTDFFKEQQRIIVHKSLSKLNNDYYSVIYLEYFENMTIKEIAKVLNKTTRQVSNISYRAKQLLKAELIKEGVDYEGL